MIRGLLLLLTLTSCGAYRNHFDSCACAGICGSVSQIEARIVETAEGPDYIACSVGSYSSGQKARAVETVPDKSKRRRIWVAPQESEDGHYIDSHYIWGPSC